MGTVFFLAGILRAEHVFSQEERVRVSLETTGVQSLFGTVEDIELKEEKEQFVLLLKECEFVYEGKCLVPVDMKGRITAEYRDEKELPEPGDVVEIKGEFALPDTATNPGEWDYRAYCYARHIGFNGWGDSVKVVQSGGGVRKIAYRFLRKASKILDMTMEETDAGILKAVILGEKQDLDYMEKSWYQKNGISHLLAISGLHISLLGMGCWQIFRRTGAGLVLSGLAAGSFVLLYAWLTGMGASAVRAAVMFGMVMGANVLGRTYDIWSALAAAMFLLLWDSPRYLWDAGFQLSFAAVASIAGAGNILAEWVLGAENERMQERLWKRRRRWQAFLASLAVQWGTIPVVCFWYFEFPPYAVVLNLLVIPFMGVVVLSGLLVLLLGGISGARVFSLMAAGPAHFVLLWYHKMCVLFQQLPGARCITGRPKLKWILLYYGVFAGLLLVLYRRVQRNKKVQQNGGVEQMRHTMPLCKTGVLLVVMLLSILLLRPEPVQGMEVYFLDVGQGDGILIRTEGMNILLDGGSADRKRLGEYTLEPCLKSMEICEIDYAFVSHGDNDHISGLKYLLAESEEIKIKNLVLPKGQNDVIYEELRTEGEDAGAQVLEFGSGDVWQKGKLRLTGLHPEAGIAESDRNRQSIVMLAEYGGCGILFTGDIEREIEKKLVEKYGENIRKKKIMVLKAAHHGAKTSTTESFLDMVNPQYTVLSYEEGNRYGHPSEETVERLIQSGTKIVSTAENGAVYFQYN